MSRSKVIFGGPMNEEARKRWIDSMGGSKLHPEHPFELELILSPDEARCRQEEINKLRNDRIFKIPDRYLSRQDEITDGISAELYREIYTSPQIFDIEDGRHWLHIPYNDRDVIDRRASLMEHLKAQCLEMTEQSIVNVDSPEFFSGSLAFIDPCHKAVEFSSCDRVIHIALSEDVYEEFQSRQFNSDTIGKTVLFCNRYCDADEFMLEDMENGYYPLLKANDFVKCFLINWNDSFWECLSDPEVSLAIGWSSDPPSWSNKRIAYTSYDPSRPGDLVVASDDAFKQAIKESDSMKKFDTPEEAYMKSNFRKSLDKSYVDERVLYINPNNYKS